MLIRVGSVFSVLSLVLVAAACNSDDGTQAYKASTTVSSLAVSGSVVTASRSDADSTQPNSVDTSETTPEVGVNDAEGDVPGFDFKFDGIPVIASFDEYSKITNDAAFKLGIAAWIFDPQKAGGRWTFRFNGATGGAVSEDVTQVQSVGLFVYESMAGQLLSKGYKPAQVKVEGASGPCVSFAQPEDALFLMCGFENMTIDTVGRPGISLDKLVAIAASSLVAPTAIGVTGGPSSLPGRFAPHPVLGAGAPFPLTDSPLGPTATSFDSFSEALSAVEAVMRQVGVSAKAFDVSALKLSRHWFDGAMLLSVGPDYAVAQSLGSITPAQIRSEFDLPGINFDGTLTDATLDDGTPCIFVSTIQRSNLTCDGGGVLLQVIAAGAADGESEAKAMENALAVAKVLSNARKAVP